MKKFAVLLKKELKEMLTLQTLFSFVICAAAFFLLGNFMNSVTETAAENAGKIALIDQDDTPYTRSVIDALKQSGFTVYLGEKTESDPIAFAGKHGRSSAMVIPQGFTQGLMADNAQPQKIKVYDLVTSGAITASLGSMDSAAVEAISRITSDQLLAMQGVKNAELARDPVQTEKYTQVSGHTAQIDSAEVYSFLSSQSMLIPIVVFLLIVFASQMIISAIVNEKNDKTLETLLSAPIQRTSILFSKMIAAGLVSLVNASVFMFGYGGFMNQMDSSDLKGRLLSSLGLQITVPQYVLIGVQLFLTILIALTISILLGSLAEDIKAAQTVVMPVMAMVMIPYFICLFADVNMLPTAAKLLVYAIPFTHTFMAIPNTLFGNQMLFFVGIGYQLVFFIICMVLAVKLFSSDKILTLKINFGKKRAVSGKKRTGLLGK